MTDKIKSKRIKPDLPGGFRDYAPADAIAKQGMIDVIRRTFESFGFDPLETSSVQKTEVLTGGETDSQSIIFSVRGSQDRDPIPVSGIGSLSDTSLRFDLTVPLARFVAANPEIPKPFKRYQIGNVWRGERQQAGRYREFMQADVDIVGAASLDADAEMVIIIDSVLKKLGLDNFAIKINDRKSYDRLPDEYETFPNDQRVNMPGIMREIDKADKIGMPAVLGNIYEFYGGSGTSAAVQKFLESPTTISELRDVETIARQNGVENITIDKTIVRGLSYYTGTVFETILTDVPEIGSIAGGGRYDDLVAKFTGQTIPAVGVSIGVDRLFAAMEKLGRLERKETLTDVLIFQLDPVRSQTPSASAVPPLAERTSNGIDGSLKTEYLAMASELRAAGIRTSLYLGEDRSFQAQLAYAVKKEIPYVVIYGAGEKEKGVVAIKNLQTREQKEIQRDQVVGYLERAMRIPRLCQCG